MSPSYLAVQIMSGITGSNALAVMLRNRGFGFVGNSAIGAIGGLLGAPALAALLGATEGAAYLIQTVAGSGSGGAALIAAAGLVRTLAHR